MGERTYKKGEKNSEWNYQSKPKQKKRRAMRNKANKEMRASGRISKGDGQDVHHKDRNPMNTKRSNLAVASKAYNRSRNS